MTKNVNVTDKHGKQIGTTYPKRARGLVRNGRAIYVDDCTIRLSAESVPSDNISEDNQMKYIYFNPREWSIGQNNTEKNFISDFDGGLTECIMLGAWDCKPVQIQSPDYLLERNTEYGFVFWLNGGENERGDELCLLQIMFDGDGKNCNTYKLNRHFIAPLLHYQGWELYNIPFDTPAGEEGSKVAVRLGFVAGNAPMAVKTALEPEVYKDWKDSPDEFAAQRPQRHNIVFEDGWPSIRMYGGGSYSTEILRKRRQEETAQMNRRDFQDLSGRYEAMSAAYAQMQERFKELRSRDTIADDKMEALESLFMAATAELANVAGQIAAIRAESVEDHMNGIAGTMDFIKEILDTADTPAKEV